MMILINPQKKHDGETLPDEVDGGDRTITNPQHTQQKIESFSSVIHDGDIRDVHGMVLPLLWLVSLLITHNEEEKHQDTTRRNNNKTNLLSLSQCSCHTPTK